MRISLLALVAAAACAPKVLVPASAGRPPARRPIEAPSSEAAPRVVMEAAPSSGGGASYSIEPSQAERWHREGLAALSAGLPLKAEGCFLRALEADPDHEASRAELEALARAGSAR